MPNEKPETEKLPEEKPEEIKERKVKYTQYALIAIGFAILVANQIYDIPGKSIFGEKIYMILGVLLIIIGGYDLIKFKKKKKEIVKREEKGYSTTQLINYIYEHYRIFDTPAGKLNLINDFGPVQAVEQDPNPNYLRLVFPIRRGENESINSSIPVDEIGHYTHTVVAINRFNPEDFRFMRVKLDPELHPADKKKVILDLPLTEEKHRFEYGLEYKPWINKKYKFEIPSLPRYGREYIEE